MIEKWQPYFQGNFFVWAKFPKIVEVKRKSEISQK